MATIRVGFKRTFQMRPYETQVIELSLEDEVKGGPVQSVNALEANYKLLQQLGSDLMTDALEVPDPRDAQGKGKVPRP